MTDDAVELSETSLEALAEEADGPGTPADHDLPPIRMVARNYEPGRIGRRVAAYSREAVDEAIRDYHDVLDRWAGDRGYDVATASVDMYEEPVHDDLRRRWRGSLDLGGPDATVRVWTDRSPRSVIRGLDFLEVKPSRMGKNDMLRVEADGFDARAVDDYAELYFLTESVLGDHGEVTYREPETPL